MQPTITPPPEGRSAPARPRRGWLRRITTAVGSFAIMAVICVFGVFLLLSRGPVSMPALGERVAAALERRIGTGIDVSVGATKIERTEAGLELHVYDIVFRDAAGKEILRAPEALMGFDPLAILAFRIELRRLALKGIVFQALVKPDGDIRLSTGLQPAPATDAARLQDGLGALAALARHGQIFGLSELSVTEARLVIDDQRVGREIVFDRMSAVLETPARGRASLSGSVSRYGATIPYRLDAATDGDGARLTLDVSRIPLRIAETIGGTEVLAMGGDSTAGLRASVLVGADGAPQSGSADMSLTPGEVKFPALFDGPWRIAKAQVSASWRAEQPKEAAVRLTFDGDGGAGVLAGTLALPTPEDPDFRFAGRTEGVALTPLTPRDGPIAVSEGTLSARLSGARDTFVINSLKLKGPETAIELSGSITKDSPGPSAELRLTAGPMPVRAALRWWPTGVAGEGRAWLIGAVEAGHVKGLTLSLKLPPPAFAAWLKDEAVPPDAVRLDVLIEGGVMRPLAGMPPIAGLSVSGWLDARKAEFMAPRGSLDLPGGARRIQLFDGVATLEKLDTYTPDIAIAFRAQAAAEHAAELMRMPALRNVLALDINPQDIRGQLDGRGRISFPLGKTLGKGDIVTEVEAFLRNVTLEKAIGRDRLEGANLSVSADSTGVAIKGEGRWRGMPVGVTVENDAADGSSATALTFTLDEAGQRRFGLTGDIKGPLPVKVKSSREPGAETRSRVEIDLTRAAVDGLIPGFQKAAGRPGKVTFDAIERPRGYSLQNFALDSGPSSLRGQVEAMPDGTLASARLSLFRLSPGDNVRLDYDRVGAGGRIVIRGNNFDARPFLRAALQERAGPARAEKDLDLDLKTTLLSGHNGEVLTNAEVRLQRRSGQFRQVAVSGRLNGKAVTVSGQAGDQAAPITIDADDAGAFLRFTDIYTRMQGGDLVGQIRQSPREIRGYIQTRNFALQNEPALRRLLNQGPQTAAPGGAETSNFTKMRIDFTRTGTSTAIRDALIFGPAIGVTFNGVVDFARDRVSLSGTYIPAYGLNNAFASIPVIGTILGGGRNEGLLGITFGVSGRASQPQVSVNPLSAVAPGIFRKIFEFRNDRSPPSSTSAINPN